MSILLIRHLIWSCLVCIQVVAGQTAALALKKVKRNQVRKGMVLVDERAKPKASWEFDADIAILTHSTTIQPRYQVGHATDMCTLYHQDCALITLLICSHHVCSIVTAVEHWHQSRLKLGM